MNCSAAPTIGGTVSSADTRAAATSALEAIVFREVLEPLAAGLGPLGEVALGSVADTLFVRPKP